jgi:hypothetical protein
MKKSTLLVLLSIFWMQAALSQANCSKYYPMIEGASFQYTNYNKKGKIEGKVSYKVIKVSAAGDNTSATMALQLKDEKGKEIYNTDYNFTCTGNMVTVDYESLVPTTMLEQYKDMEMEISGTDLELPNDLSVGQQLTDANVTMKISMGGINMNTTVDLINRKVEKQESVTTSAGTFECFVIYTDNKIKAMVAKQNFPSRIWFSEGVGMIKQESYNKNGKLIGSTQLTGFSK